MCTTCGLCLFICLSPINSKFKAVRRDLRERKPARTLTSSLYSMKMNSPHEKAVQAILYGHSCAMRLKLRLDDPMADSGLVSSYDLAKSIVDCFSNAISVLSDKPKSEDDQFSDLSSRDSPPPPPPPHPQKSQSKKRYTQTFSLCVYLFI